MVWYLGITSIWALTERARFKGTQLNKFHLFYGAQRLPIFDYSCPLYACLISSTSLFGQSAIVPQFPACSILLSWLPMLLIVFKQFPGSLFLFGLGPITPTPGFIQSGGSRPHSSPVSRIPFVGFYCYLSSAYQSCLSRWVSCISLVCLTTLCTS